MWPTILMLACLVAMFGLGLIFGREYFTGELITRKAELESELSSVKKRNSELEGREAEWQRAFSRLKKRLTTLSNENDRLTSENGRHVRAAKAHDSEVRALKDEIAALQQRLAEGAADYEALENRAAEDYALGRRPRRTSRRRATTSRR